MPRPRAKKSARRPYRRRRTYRRRRMVSARRYPVLSGFPSRKLVKLRYVDTGVNLDPGVGNIAQVVYRANSVYDPYQTGVGHQPMGFDQWAAIYNKYTVLGAKMTMTFTPLSTSNSIPGRMGILLSSDTAGTSAFTSINNLLESKLVGMNVKTYGLVENIGDKRYATSVKKFSAKKFFGKVNVVDGSANSADVTGNPGNEAYFIPWAAAQANAQDPAVATFTITIDYITLFHDPKNLDGS